MSPRTSAAKILLHEHDVRAAGEMAARLSAYDWASSPIGHPDHWPECMTSVVDLVLSSQFPMFLLWGPDRVLIYNDAYIPVLGAKHPWAFGHPFAEVWPEVRDAIEPIIDRAYAGQASFFEDLPVVLYRGSEPEQTFFTFSYSPVRTKAGQITGALCTLNETTSKVLAEQRLAFFIRLTDRLRGLADPADVVSAAAEMLGEHLGTSRVGYGEVDETGRFFTTPSNWTDGTVAHHAGTHDLASFGPAIHEALKRGETLAVHDVAADLRTGGAESQAAFSFLETAAAVTVSLVKQGRMTAALYVHNKTPRVWSDSEVHLIKDVAERTWDAVERARAETALRESESRLRLAIDAGRMAVWEHDAATDSIVSTPELKRLYGYPPDAALGIAEVRSHYYPGERERLIGAATDAVKRGSRFFSIEFRSYRLDGSLRWFLIRAEMILGSDGRPVKTVGVVLDVTERKEAEDVLREREAELRAALNAGELAPFDYDHTTGEMRPSSRLSELYGYPPEHHLTIAEIRSRYHPDDVEEIWSRRRLDNDDPTIRQFDWTLRLLLPDGTLRWVNGRGEYLRDDNGRISRSRGVVMDVTPRKRWEEHQQLLINELNHRVKNTLATVQSIASQTLRNTESTGEARSALEARLFALSRAHDVLTRENWESASLKEIVDRAVEPYRHDRESRLHIGGPDVRLSPRMALAIAMALQELATNAVKYGALSNDVGEVHITWRVVGTLPEERLILHWLERGGPPVRTPTRRGFGTRLIERSLAQDLGGDVNISFAQAGVVCTVDAPMR